MKKIVARLLCLAALFTPAAAIAQSAASDFTSGTRYDLAHRVTGTIAPDPDGSGPLHHLAVRNTYDGEGRLVRVEKGELSSWQSEAIAPASWSGFTPHQKVETSYDLLDRKVKETVSGWNTSAGAWDAPIAVTQYSYDTVGRLQCTAVRMDPAWFGSLPASACDQSNTSNPIDRITRNVYDDAGQLVQVRKAMGTPIEQAYVTYSYTPNGKQEYVTDANGNKARLTWDEFDRQAQWQFPSASTPGAVNTNDYEAYSYDANGNRVTARKRDGRVFGFTYDNLNRMTVKTVPDACVSGYACTNVPSSMTRDVYYTYDARGQQTSARFDSFSGGDAVISNYDGFGRLISSTTAMGGVGRMLSYQYDADGNRVRVTHPDGNYVNYYRDGLDRLYYADQAGVGPLFYPPYDAQGRVSVLYRWANGAWNNYTAYGYDPVSRPNLATSVLTSGGYNVTATFAYNAANQIVTRTRDNNLYAFSGYTSVNRSYTPNGLNQYASVAGNSYGYDSNGNLTADGINAYTYDAENRLVVTSAGAQLTYDPLGRLYETYKASTGITRLLYDGDQLTAEYDGSGNMLRRYVHSDGDDDPLVWYEGSGVSAPRYLYSDHQGSIVAVTDASGNVTKVNAYDEYGIPSAGNDVTTAGRFQYTGQAWIPELGMYYYKARIYSPTLGRFMQTDPIGYEDQFNLYAYVGNDPVDNRDPTGECTGTHLCNADTGEALSSQGIGSSGWGSAAKHVSGEGLSSQQQRTETRGIGDNSRRFRTPRIGAAPLRNSEGGIRNGHLLRLHVGKTDAFLQGRIRREKLRNASTFSSEPLARAALTEAVRKDSIRINNWLNSESPGSYRATFDSPIALGRVMSANGEVRQAYRAVFILLPFGTEDGGDFQVLTGWVE